MKRLFVLAVAVLLILIHLTVAQRVSAQPFFATGNLSVSPSVLDTSSNQSLTVFGSGFPDSDVNVCISQTGQCKTARGPSFSLTFYVFNLSPGVYQITGTPAPLLPGQGVASTSFTVVDTPPQPAVGQIYASPNPVQSGGTLNVTGSGWTPGYEVGVCLVNAFGQRYSCDSDVPIDSNGGFGFYGAQISIPSTTSGSVTVVAYYQDPRVTGEANTFVQVLAQNTTFTLSSYSVKAGGTITISGSGFQPGTVTATVTDVSGNVVGTSGQQAVGAGGSVFVTLPVNPGAPAGLATVTIYNNGALVGQPAVISVTGQPTLTLSPNTADPGTKINVTGSGYPANNIVNISATFPVTGGGAPVTVTGLGTTDGSGNLGVGFPTAQIEIPTNAAPGPVTVTATGNGASTSATATLNVEALEPDLDLVPGSVVAGGSVSAVVTGFLPGNGTSTNPVTVSAAVPLTGGGQQQVATIIYPNSSGTGSGTLAFPAGAFGGVVIVSANQPASGAQTSNTSFQVEAPPTPTPTPTSTPTPIPTDTPLPTATPTDTATATPTPPKKMHFKFARLQWPAVRAGTYNILSLQANQGGRIAVRVVVTLPNGHQNSFAGFTHGPGKFTLTIPVPASALSSGGSGTATVQIRLQKGKRGVGRVLTFSVVK